MTFEIPISSIELRERQKEIWKIVFAIMQSLVLSNFRFDADQISQSGIRIAIFADDLIRSALL